MKSVRTIIVAGAVLAALTFPKSVRADDKDQDKDNKVVAEAIVVHFGAPQPQGAPAAITHLLLPDDVTIKKGQAVNFVVNGGGHGIAIHQVSKNTTRDDIAADLCQGGSNEADRLGRSAVCNGTIVTGVDTIIGTQNLAYEITDGKDDLVIDVPQNIANNNPRVDDIQHSHRLLATSGRAAGDTSPSGALAAGAFLTGTTPPTPANPNTTPPTPANPTGNAGNRINVQFLKAGRYLVICMNRAHSLNDHMFGFVNVVDDDDDK
jgi:plastocyanin